MGVNAAVAGVYTLVYSVSDNAGNAAIPQTRTVTVKKQVVGPDVTPPVITLKGKNPDTVKVGSGAYTDPGYTAIDDVDGDVTSKVTVSELFGKPLPISLAQAGSYTLVYTVSDKAGNPATVTRVVYVVGQSNDKTPPVITLSGAVSCTVMVGKRYTDPGYSATDDVDLIITAKVQRAFKDSSGAAADSATFTNKIGKYTITYTVSDAAGNAATPAIRKILVQDTTGNGSSLLIKYGVPLSLALPSVTKTYTKVTTDGAGAPSVSNITSFAFSWDATQKNVYQFGMQTSNGVPSYYVDLSGAVNKANTFGQASPGFTLASSGFSGLDGSYYVKADATQCVWVSTNGKFAIIFTP